MTERNGQPGPRYDEMTQQNQSPVVTDEMVEAGWGAVSPGFMNSRADIRRVLEAALPSGVRVKPLEWVLDKPAMGDRYTAQSSLGEYTVRLKDGYMWEPGNESFPSTHDDPKAAAQADYERRILAAIEPTQAPEDENEKLERYDREIQQTLTAPAPAELEVVTVPRYAPNVQQDAFHGMVPDVNGSWVRLTDAQAAIAAEKETYDRWADEIKAGVDFLKARVADLEKALEFYAARGNWQDDIAPDPAGTPIPYTSPIAMDYGDRARALLEAHQRGRREAMEEAVCLISDLPLDIDPDIELPDFVNGADYAIGVASAAIRAKMEEQPAYTNSREPGEFGDGVTVMTTRS